MAIVELLVSALVGVLLEKLVALELDYLQKDGAPPFSRISIRLLKKWEMNLNTIYAVLVNVENLHMRAKGPVKLWLDNVRDLVYDMEDLLDDFEIKATQAKLEAKSSTSSGLMKWKFPLLGQHKASVSNLKLLSLVSETDVKKTDERLEEIVTRKAHLRLTENVVARSNHADIRPPGSAPSEHQFFGREKEEAEILKLLIGEAQNGDAMPTIVAIVGMGGVGKTALAQQLYNSTKVVSYFEIRAWVCVSDIFNVLEITKTILRSIRFSCKDENLDKLQVQLKDNISGKKFLVVLDAVWNENHEKWTKLLKPFEMGAKGSKIIVTTRNSAVVSIIGASLYPLKELSLDYCVRLLAFYALGATNFESHQEFEVIGKKIAERCKGLPLAAKLLGDSLRSNRSPNAWEDALNNIIRDHPTAENNVVLPLLKSSYDHLPAFLKRCFVYCAVFPKGYKIERDELVLLWIAEGFLDGPKAVEKILRLGWNYFDELVTRSLLQQSSVDPSKFSMHDFLNDLAKSVADETCFRLGESQLVGNEDDASLEKARHATFTSSGHITSCCLRACARMDELRSLMFMPNRFDQGSRKCSISRNEMQHLLTKLKYLRVFSLCHCSIAEIPDCIGDLKHLRYLNFSSIDIERLPAIGALCRLQVLIVRDCQKLSMLPQGIANLQMYSQLINLEITNCPALELECFPPLPTTLSFLKLDSCPKIKSLPNQWHHLTSLWRLEIRRCQGIKCLPEGGLPPNLQELSISECGNLKQQVREWDLNKLKLLKTLLIDFCMGDEGEKVWFPSKHEDAWSLLFPSSLTSLYIKNMRNVERLSSGLRHYLSSLKQLRIENCPKLRYLPEDGFPPSLLELHILKILKD